MLNGKFGSYLFIQNLNPVPGSDEDKFTQLVQQQQAFAGEGFPADGPDALIKQFDDLKFISRLKKARPPKPDKEAEGGSEAEGATFATAGGGAGGKYPRKTTDASKARPGAVPNSEGVYFSNIKCNNCGQYGHYQSDCEARESAAKGGGKDGKSGSANATVGDDADNPAPADGTSNEEQVHAIAGGVEIAGTGKNADPAPSDRYGMMFATGLSSTDDPDPSPLPDFATAIREVQRATGADRSLSLVNIEAGGVAIEVTEDVAAYGYSFTTSEDGVNRYWVLLDNQSTVDLFCNEDLLRKGSVHDSDKWIRIRSDGGVTRTCRVGYLDGYGWVWVNPKGVHPLLSPRA